MSLENPEKWYLHLPKLQRFLNNTFQRAVQTTPFELLTGTKMKSEEDHDLLEIIEQEAAKYYEEERDMIRERAKRAIGEIQEENKRSYNRRRKEAVKYSVNDIVAIERTQFTTGSKIKPKFFGPYKVSAVKGFDRYEVEKIGDHEGPKTTTTSADKMKQWVEGCDDIEEYEESGEDEEAGGNEDELC